MITIPLKYRASIRMALRQQLGERGQIVGRLFLYMIIVYLFYQVFQSVDGSPTRIWYVAITEWIILSTHTIAFQIAEDINNGRMIYYLLKPFHYVHLKLCEAAGIFLVRFSILGILCLILGRSFTHFIPGTLSTWLIGACFAAVGVLLNGLIQILIGLSAFWLKDIKTLIYLNLTATFCFGGLIVPLDFYSNTLRMFSFLTPFPWILWCPAQVISNHPPPMVYALLTPLLWVAILGGSIYLLYQRCLRSFVAEGV